jgi:hypothetical protein
LNKSAKKRRERGKRRGETETAAFCALNDFIGLTRFRQGRFSAGRRLRLLTSTSKRGTDRRFFFGVLGAFFEIFRKLGAKCLREPS